MDNLLPEKLEEFHRYIDQKSLSSQKAWDWEPLSYLGRGTLMILGRPGE